MNEEWTINMTTGNIHVSGKDTGVSFAEVVTLPEMQEFIRNEIDREILAELMKVKK